MPIEYHSEFPLLKQYPCWLDNLVLLQAFLPDTGMFLNDPAASNVRLQPMILKDDGESMYLTEDRPLWPKGIQKKREDILLRS